MKRQLSDDDVREIRRLALVEFLPYKEIGAKFGIHPGSATKIAMGHRRAAVQ